MLRLCERLAHETFADPNLSRSGSDKTRPASQVHMVLVDGIKGAEVEPHTGGGASRSCISCPEVFGAEGAKRPSSVLAPSSDARSP